MNPADHPRSAHDPFAGAPAQQSFAQQSPAGQSPAGQSPAPMEPAAVTQERELSVPEANQRRWSGKKTAVVAAMAIGLASAGAAGASASVPLGSSTVSYTPLTLPTKA